MIRIIITAALSPVDVDNLSNHVNLVFLSLTFSLNLFSPLLIAALNTTFFHSGLHVIVIKRSSLPNH